MRTRKILVFTGMFALTVTPVSSARLDPTAMVLRKGDVPRAYTVLRANTGFLPNERAAQGNKDLIRNFVRWGRVTGYRVEYDGGIKGTIGSSVDLFRRPSGARSFLAWNVLQIPPNTGLTLVRRQAGLGDDAFVYRKDFGTTVFVVVEWRYRNVCAHVGADSVGVRGAIALARAQQRRIVAALS